MPSNLDIETSKDLNGTMAAYSEQIIISTGQADWKSKIEDERDTAPWGNVVSEIKTMLGPRGRYHDVGRNLSSGCTPDVSLTRGNSHTAVWW